MTVYNKRVFEMVARVLVFWTKYRDLIVKGSVPDQLFSQLDGVFQNLSTLATRQAGCKDTVVLSTGARVSARQDLVAQLETICGTAFGLGLDQFWMPKRRDDRAFVRAGRNFLEQLQPLQAMFIEAHLPQDFLEKLQTAVQKLNEAILKQTEIKGNRMEATAAMQGARNEALTLVKRLAPLMNYLLRDNPPVRAVWDSERHRRKVGSSVKPATDDGPGRPHPEAPAQPNTAATANTA